MYMWHRKIHNPRQKLKEQPKAAAAAKGKRQTTKARAQIATVSVNRLTHMFSTHIVPIYIYTYISLSIYIFAKPKTCSKQWNFSACAASVQLLVFVLVLFLALVQYLPSSRSNFKSVGINFKQIYTQIHLTHPHVLVCLCVCVCECGVEKVSVGWFIATSAAGDRQRCVWAMADVLPRRADYCLCWQRI